MARGVELQLNPETGEFEAVLDSEQESKIQSQLSEDENSNLILPHSEDSKIPAQTFNPYTAEFEWADENMQKLHNLRRKIRSKDADKLKVKENTMKYGLEEIGLSASDLGKTGDSRTGVKSEKDERVGASQLEDYKSTVSDEQWVKLAKWKETKKNNLL